MIARINEFNHLCTKHRGRMSLQQQREHRRALARVLSQIEGEGQVVWGRSWTLFDRHGDIADTTLTIPVGEVRLSSFFTTQHQRDIAFILWHPDLRERALTETVETGKKGAVYLRPLNTFKGCDIRDARANMVVETSEDAEIQSLLSHPFAGGPWGPQDRPMPSLLHALRTKIKIMTMKDEYCDTQQMEYKERDADTMRHPCTFDDNEFQQWRMLMETRIEVERHMERLLRRVEGRSQIKRHPLVHSYITCDTDDTDTD